jgi:sterol desaturase/sphingolipid hydroxylase (fatty acid hydroxylase superfamily)
MMHWLILIRDSWLQTLGWLAGLAVIFGVLARLMPCNPGMFWWKDRRAVVTDFIYWFVVPLFMLIGRVLMLLAGLALLFGGQEPHLLPVKHLPLWQQCLAIQLIQDVLLYWIHRLFHTRLAWKFHAVHHSPHVLDWMSTARFHPVNNLLSFVLADVAVLLMGFAPAALAFMVPFNIVYSSMVHANLNWTFGPLRYLFASPVFHRWHHTTQEEGLDRNFAPTFPFLDVIFGTFHMPPGKLPEHFGTGEADFPVDFWGQCLYPFRALLGRRAAVLAAAALCVSLLGGGYFLACQRARDEQGAQRAQASEAKQAMLRHGGAVLRHDLKRGTPVLGVALGGDGRCLVAGSSDGAVTVWDAISGQQKLVLTGHKRGVRSVAVGGDGKLVVSGSFDQTLTVWDLLARQERFTRSGQSGVLGVAIGAGAKRIVSGSALGSVRIWDAVTGAQTGTLPGGVGAITSVAVSDDGRIIVWATGEKATVWDVQAGAVKCTLQGHTNLVYGVAVSPDGERIVTASFDETVKVWNARTGRLKRTLAGHRGAVYSVAISGDGLCIVSGGEDGTVRVWDATNGRAEYTLAAHTASVTSVAVSADGGRVVSGSQDGTVKVWDVPEHERETRTVRSTAPRPVVP